MNALTRYSFTILAATFYIYISAAKSAKSASVCSYGADGAWDLSAELGDKWRVLGTDNAKQCQPKPLIRWLIDYEQQRGAGRAGTADATAGGRVEGLFEWRSKPQVCVHAWAAWRALA